MNKIHYEKYNPALSIEENAVVLGCSVATVKTYIKKKGIDRKYDSHYLRRKRINDFSREHPDYSLRRKSEELGFSINTIRKYEAMPESTLDVSFRDENKISQFDIKNNNAVKSISANQNEILRWIIDLYNEGNTFDADLTASKLIFYRKIAVPSYLFDKYPQLPQIKNLEETDNLPNNVFSSIVFDLPFILSSVKSESLIKDRFTYFTSAEEMYIANDEMLERSYRLLKEGGLLVVKTMDVAYSGKQYWVSDYVIRKAVDMGFELKDKFILLSNFRLFSKMRKQRIARKYHSYFFVFTKRGISK